MTTREQASTTKYGFVTARVCKALERLNSPNFGDEHRRALKKGADFMEQLGRGAFWVGAGGVDMGYSASEIPETSRAVSTLAKLELIGRDDEAQAMLQSIARSLNAIAEGNAPEVATDKLDQFFRVLSKRFASEAVASSIGEGFENRASSRS